MICAPSTFNWLLAKLQTRVKSRRQRVLTVGKRARGGVRDGGEGGVRLEEVSEILCALHPQLVVAQTANESQKSRRQRVAIRQNHPKST